MSRAALSSEPSAIIFQMVIDRIIRDDSYERRWQRFQHHTRRSCIKVKRWVPRERDRMRIFCVERRDEAETIDQVDSWLSHVRGMENDDLVVLVLVRSAPT